MARVAVRHVGEVFDSQVVVLLPDANGRLALSAGRRHGRLAARRRPRRRAMGAGPRRARRASAPTRCPASEALYLPLKGTQAVLGVLGVLPANPRRVLLPEQFHLLETFAGQIALALERAQLAEQAQRAQRRRRDRGPAQRPARLDLARPAHAARGDRRAPRRAWPRSGERLTPQEREALARSIFEQSQRDERAGRQRAAR